MATNPVVGVTAVITCTYTDENGVLVNPATQTVRVKDPNGAVATPALAFVSLGVYTAAYPVTVEGLHRGQCEGTSPNIIDKFTFCADASDVT